MKFASVLLSPCLVLGSIAAEADGTEVIKGYDRIMSWGAWLYTKITAQPAGEKYHISPPLPATVSREKKGVLA